MSAVTRAFAVGAITGMRGDYASQSDLANTINRTQQGISKLIQRVEQKPGELSVSLWDEILYENELSCGRSALLTQDQKNGIIEVVTSSQTNRGKESSQAISHSDFSNIIPTMSVTTFENVMYGAGYARRHPGWKPKLTPEQEKDRYELALKHKPDLHTDYDNAGFNFPEVLHASEMPARIGEEQGMQRTWCKELERWDEGVKHERNHKNCTLQLYGTFLYDHKGSCHVCYPDIIQEKELDEVQLKLENANQAVRDNKLRTYARAALTTAVRMAPTVYIIPGRSSTCLQQWITSVVAEPGVV